jgi:hypothetical protein
MAEGFVIGVTYGGVWRSLGNYAGGSTLTTNYTISKGTCCGAALLLCSNHGSTSLTYARAGVYLVEFPHTDTSINSWHISGDNEWSFGVSSNLLTVSGGGTNWASWVVLLGNKP